MKRVIVTKRMLSIIAMQVCAVKDATDEEILEVCNNENPSGTTSGWGIVVRTDDSLIGEKAIPVQCDKYPDRLHFIVLC